MKEVRLKHRQKRHRALSRRGANADSYYWSRAVLELLNKAGWSRSVVDLTLKDIFIKLSLRGS